MKGRNSWRGQLWADGSLAVNRLGTQTSEVQLPLQLKLACYCLGLMTRKYISKLNSKITFTTTTGTMYLQEDEGRESEYQ